MRHLVLASAVLVSAFPIGLDAQTTNAPQLREVKPAAPLTLPSDRRKIVCGTIVVTPDPKTHYTLRQVGPRVSDRSKYSMHRVTPPECVSRPDPFRRPTR
jgi:hypothetical protein